MNFFPISDTNRTNRRFRTTLKTIKGIEVGKVRQITTLLKLAKLLTIPLCDHYSFELQGDGKDIFNLLEP